MKNVLRNILKVEKRNLKYNLTVQGIRYRDIEEKVKEIIEKYRYK